MICFYRHAILWQSYPRDLLVILTIALPSCFPGLTVYKIVFLVRKWRKRRKAAIGRHYLEIYISKWQRHNRAALYQSSEPSLFDLRPPHQMLVSWQATYLALANSFASSSITLYRTSLEALHCAFGLSESLTSCGELQVIVGAFPT